MNLPARLQSKIFVQGDCWIWTAARDRRGYGRVWWEDGTKFAHRVVYTLLVGDPGPELDHLCRNPACVNPAHLEPVTHAVNVSRGTAPSVLSAKYAVSRTCPQGHPLSGENLYLHYSAKWQRLNRQCRRCRRDGKRRRRANAPATTRSSPAS
jgi:hypothetical protein